MFTVTRMQLDVTSWRRSDSKVSHNDAKKTLICSLILQPLCNDFHIFNRCLVGRVSITRHACLNWWQILLHTNWRANTHTHKSDTLNICELRPWCQLHLLWNLHFKLEILGSYKLYPMVILICEVVSAHDTTSIFINDYEDLLDWVQWLGSFLFTWGLH